MLYAHCHENKGMMKHDFEKGPISYENVGHRSYV